MKEDEKAKNTAIEQAVKGGAVELVVRTGEAQEIRDPESIAIINGTIGAPYDFFKKKHGKITRINKEEIIKFHDDEVLLRVSGDAGKLSLTCKDENHFQHVIDGQVVNSKELAIFKINTNHLFSVKDLKDLIRVNKFWFENSFEAVEFIKQLETFNATVKKRIENHNDNSGNARNLYETVVEEVEAPKEFKLKMPIYKGEDKKSFRVEVAVDASDQSIKFYLLSDELYSLLISEKERLLDEQIKNFESHEQVTIVRLCD